VGRLASPPISNPKFKIELPSEFTSSRRILSFVRDEVKRRSQTVKIAILTYRGCWRFRKKHMSDFLVAVINGTRARFLTLEEAQFPECESGPNLVEHRDILNLAKEMRGQELWANVKTGRNQGAGGQAHGYDDHRENHLSEFGRRFAQAIAAEIVNLSQVHHPQHLLLVAEPQILGMLRETLAAALPKNFNIQELTKDLCKLKPQELHEYLATKNLLPVRKKVPG
jgi:protein required for attachment to host cells